MKKYLIFLVFSSWVELLQAQPNSIDSLKKLLQNERQDSVTTMRLAYLSREFYFSNTDSALKYGQIGLAMAKKINFLKGEAMCLQATGDVFIATGNYPKALEVILERVKIFESINDQLRIPGALNDLGNVHSYLGQYNQALDCFLKAIMIVENRLEKQPSTVDYNKELLVSSCIGIGNAYEKRNQLDSARIYTQRAYELSIQLNYISGISTALNNLGNIYSIMGQNTIAFGFYRSALLYFNQEEDNEGICESSLGLSKLFQKLGDKDSCLYYSHLSLNTAQNGGLTKYLLDASIFLTNYYKSVNNIDSAFIYQSISIVARDSLYSQEKTKQVQNLFYEETIRQQKLKEKIEKEREYRKRNIQLGLIAVFIPIFAALVYFFSRKRKKNGKVIVFLGAASLLMLFEFISLIIHPAIEKVTNHNAILMYLTLLMIAFILAPLHHRLEKFVKRKV